MDIKITKDNQNLLLARREVEFTVTHDGATPTRVHVLGKIAAMLNVNTDQVVLDPFRTEFGISRLKGEARVYETKEARDKLEPEYLMKRGMREEAQDAPPEEPSSEGTAEA
ncbi:MAG: 30S ribosomal protein S24e [Euryarchaeota archaeon]|nr:30S ribosomal protein S24e [Euryarchaeota archaeon]